MFFERFEGHIINKFDKVAFHAFKLKLGSNNIKGNFEIAFAKEKTNIKGNVETQVWHSFLSSKQVATVDKTILNKTLPDDWLTHVSANVMVKINKLQLQDDMLNNAKFNIEIKNNRLSVVYEGH